MSPWRWSPAIEIARAQHIAEVLIRNGLGALAHSAGLSRFVPPWRKRRRSLSGDAATLSTPKRVRRTLEELGPTYIKLGQILSTRPDIVPPAYVVELSKLLDSAPPVPGDEIIQVIEHELGVPLDHHFSRFDPQPIASASIGQVHCATLQDGTDVVVKVQRPGVERVIEADLNLLRLQARFLEARSQTLAHYGLVDIIEEFSQALHDELDYTIEGRNADRLREMITGQDAIIPKVYWESTTRRVITLTDLKGIKLNEIDRLKAHGYALRSIAELTARIYLQQVFVHGVFHADPHPANILVCDRKIGLVDFGVVAYITPTLRKALGDALFALVRQNADDIVHIILQLGAPEPSIDRDALRRDVQRVLVRYYGVSLESLPFAEFLGELLSLSFKHKIRMPADMALLARTVVILEGVTRNLDPTFNIAQQLEPFVTQLITEQLSLKDSLSGALTCLRELETLLAALPRRVESLTGQLERGDLTLGIDIHHFSQSLRKLDAIGNRLSFSIVVAALIIGSAWVLSSGASLGFRIPFTQISIPIAQIGFLAAALLGAWLLISILRSKGL